MATKKPQARRETAILVRLSVRERELIERTAGREPLGTFLRRIVLDYCERQKAKGKA